MTGPRLRVLVVDDDEDIRLLCRVNLESLGAEVLEAANAADLMRIVKGDVRPDVVVLDLTLPDRDGLDCLAELRRDPNLGEVAVVVLSAHVGEQSRERAFELGANEYVDKPFEPARLLRVIQTLAHRS